MLLRSSMQSSRTDSDASVPLRRAGELKQCAQLRSLSVENNRLATPLLDLRPLGSLRSLQLFGNPLEYLPELSHCTALRHLSLANVPHQCRPGTCLAGRTAQVAGSILGEPDAEGTAAGICLIWPRNSGDRRCSLTSLLLSPGKPRHSGCSSWFSDPRL